MKALLGQSASTLAGCVSKLDDAEDGQNCKKKFNDKYSTNLKAYVCLYAIGLTFSFSFFDVRCYGLVCYG